MAPIIKSVFGGGGGGDGVANLAYTASPTQGTITSDTGTDATIPAADGTNAGLFLPAEKTKLAGIAEGAEVNVQSDWNAVSGDAQILNKPTLGTAAATNSTDYATAAQGAKADSAVQPAALASYQPIATVLTNTTASFTTDQETKLAGIAEGAEVNVQSDWNAVSGDAQILNKPTLGTAAATNSTDYATAAQGAKADSAVQLVDTWLYGGI
jgi:2-keto-3-deoxy-galactonokinase